MTMGRRLGCRLCCPCGGFSTGKDYGSAFAHQFFGECLEPVELAFGQADIETYALAIDKPVLGERVAQELGGLPSAPSRD